MYIGIYIIYGGQTSEVDFDRKRTNEFMPQTYLKTKKSLYLDLHSILGNKDKKKFILNARGAA